jgi:putative inorganic carbon (HCO3(-)) transporter
MTALTGRSPAAELPARTGWRWERPETSRFVLPALLALAAALAIGLAVPYSPTGTIAAIVLVGGALFLLGYPDACVPLVLFILYSNASSVAVDFHGAPAIVSMALPALLLVPLAHRVAIQRQKLVFHPVFVLMLVYLAVLLVGSLGSSRPDVVTTELNTFILEGILVFLLITNAVRTPRMLRAVTWAVVLAGMFLGGLGTYQQLTGTFGNDYGGFAQITEATFATGEESLQGEVLQPRLGGPLKDQNRHAQNMLFIAVLGLFLAWSERSKGLRGLAFVAAVMAAAGCALTFSRGTAVAFVMVLAVMVLLRTIKVRNLVVIVVATMLILQLFPQYSKRLASIGELTSAGDADTAGVQATDGATRGRLNEMVSAMLAFADHPILGVGPGMFRHVFLEYSDEAGFRSQIKAREAHNLFLGVASETGAIGLGAFTAILTMVLVPLYRERRRWLLRDPPLAFLVAGYLMMVVAYLANGMFLHMAYERFFWAMIALACAAGAIARAQQVAPGETAASTPPAA